jgi:hypothetical protein
LYAKSQNFSNIIALLRTNLRCKDKGYSNDRKYHKCGIFYMERGFLSIPCHCGQSEAAIRNPLFFATCRLPERLEKPDFHIPPLYPTKFIYLIKFLYISFAQ